MDHLERIVPSDRDSKRVLKLLENPPKPTAALKAVARRCAARKYRRRKWTRIPSKNIPSK